MAGITPVHICPTLIGYNRELKKREEVENGYTGGVHGELEERWIKSKYLVCMYETLKE